MEAELETGPTLGVRLIRAADDPPLVSREYQEAIAEFSKSLEAGGIQSSARSFAFDGVGGGGGLSGEFALKVLTIVWPSLITGIAGWLHGRSGRKVRLKVGADGIEVEASTVKEVEKLLAYALEIQKQNQAKVIREP
jgi:hypothetical protein